MRFRKGKNDGGISYHASVGRGVTYQVDYSPGRGWYAHRLEIWDGDGGGWRFYDGGPDSQAVFPRMADAKAWCVTDYLAFAAEREAFDSIMEERRLVP